MRKRLFAFIDSSRGAPDIMPVRHYTGSPPELTGGQDFRERLPWPEVLILEEKADGYFVYRYTKDGRFGGDTWHPNLEEAEQQVGFEFGGLVSSWIAVPAEVEDAVAFALESARPPD